MQILPKHYAAKLKKSEKSEKSECHLHTRIKSSTFAPKFQISANIMKRTTLLFIMVIAAVGTAIFGLVSCNVTRVITTESQYVQRGDTNILIKTKTIETYDASKKSL